MPNELSTDILIVGGGTGGVAAALAACSLGHRVILTEETDWLGGQLTAQAVPPDENPWIEYGMCTGRYRAFREGVRRYYRDHYPLTPEAKADARLNPGLGGVSRLCHEPRVAVAVIDQMLAYARASGQLDVRLCCKAAAVDAAGDHLRAVTLRHVHTGDELHITATYILDATELGDLLPLGGVEYVSGSESQRDTGEPHALAGDADPEDVQSFTWCFPVAYDPTPGADYTIDKPAQYAHWRDYHPELTPAWPAKLLSWNMTHPITLEARPRVLLETEHTADRPCLWRYRRIVTRAHVPAHLPLHEVTLVNWPMNDYWCGNIIDKPQAEVDKHLEASRQLSLSLMYWMQTEAPRPDGGAGYPGLYLRPDITGTSDGLAKYPYIRESRRIRAELTVTENHVGTEARQAAGFDQAQAFDDSVGIGCYRIDLHPSTGGRNYIDIASRVFQIPLGSLICQRVENLLPACKNLGVTHITNGCYRLHPVEWNIGEAAGLLAAYCIAHHTTPRQVRHDQTHLRQFQKLCDQQHFTRQWIYPDGV